MRQETNNEMDLLLRRLGRRQETAASTDHLDADELSSYAENVLPPAARARYTEHLAECARCREFVVQLSSSAGVVAVQETAKVSAPSALRKFLASLFSPMVLRYAVPALGLVIVAGIGFIVSRQQQPRAHNVAQVTQQDRAQAPVSASESQPFSYSSGRPTDVPETPASNKTVSPQNNTAAQPVVAPPPNASPTVSTINAEVQPDATKKVEEQPVAKEVPAAPKPAASDELKKLDAEAQKQKAEDRIAVANEPPPAKAPEESKREDRRAESGTAARTARSRGEAAGIAAPQTAAGRSTALRDAEQEKDKNDADSRTVTVAGRRFRKQGNVWIDTAYDSSRSPMDLPRGSERYRTLVADEPAIKSIADQLDGEIIVVWKGHPYRIH